MRLLPAEVQVELLVLEELVGHLELEGLGEHLAIGFEQFNLSNLLWLD